MWGGGAGGAYGAAPRVLCRSTAGTRRPAASLARADAPLLPRRKRYDEHGREGLDVNFVDSAEFFSALFGSDRFEHLVRRHGGRGWCKEGASCACGV